MSGRSDATLNRYGVRLGGAEVYRVLDTLPDVDESLVVAVELADGGYWLVLFAVLADGQALDDALVARIKDALRTKASPRHVPDDVIAVRALPHTRTGKKLEVPVKRILQGYPIARGASSAAIDDFDALAQFAADARPGRTRPTLRG